jgi:hypothetical protein
LFITTTAAAVVLGVLFVPPQGIGLLAIYVAYVLLPAATVAGIVFHRGYWQAFFIGMAPCVFMLSAWIFMLQFQWFPSVWPFGPDMPNPFEGDPEQIVVAKTLFSIPLAAAGLGGTIAAGIRWWAMRIANSSEASAQN